MLFSRTLAGLLLGALLAVLAQAHEDEAGFEPIFNHQDLSGWTAAEGWAVRDGQLQVVSRGSNIFTEKEYEHFELRFDFKMSAGGNSGVYLRRGGLEVQLLDDYAERYQNLQDWQYSGALYGFVPPRERVSKQPGEWQTMALRLVGQELTVVLNGTVIVEADFDELKTGERQHAGLAPGPGRLGFQNYGGAPIALRNLRVKELAVGDAEP